MKKLSTNGLRALKVAHLICAILWIGSAVSMNLLRHFVEVEDAAGMYYMAEELEAIDMQLLVPGAIGCLFTGIVYGVWTNFGFFKHRWLTVKWVLTLFMILLGTFCMGPPVKENVTIGKALMEGVGDAGQYATNVETNAYLGALQLTLLMIVLVISVWKPWKKKNNKKQNQI